MPALKFKPISPGKDWWKEELERETLLSRLVEANGKNWWVIETNESGSGFPNSAAGLYHAHIIAVEAPTAYCSVRGYSLKIPLRRIVSVTLDEAAQRKWQELKDGTAKDEFAKAWASQGLVWKPEV